MKDSGCTPVLTQLAMYWHPSTDSLGVVRGEDVIIEGNSKDLDAADHFVLVRKHLWRRALTFPDRLGRERTDVGDRPATRSADIESNGYDA